MVRSFTYIIERSPIFAVFTARPVIAVVVQIIGKGQEDPGLKDQTQKDPDPKDHGPKDPQN